MAIQPVTPVGRQQIQKRKPSKTASTVGNVLGGIGAVAGGIAGGIGGAASGGPIGAIAGATGGTAAGFQSGRGLGSFIGERIEPTRTTTEEVAVGGGQQLGGFNVSQNGMLFAEALQILHEVPEEIANPHSRALTAAFMADLAQNNQQRSA